MRMIGLSEIQLEIIMSEAVSMEDDSCQEFLERVAAILRLRGRIDDDDVSDAVHQALRELVHSSDVWKEWVRKPLSMTENEKRAEAALAEPSPSPKPQHLFRWLQTLPTRLFFSPPVSAH